MIPTLAKQELRRSARALRLGLARPDFGEELAARAGVLGLQKGQVVGGYHAMPEEADPALLLERLVELGCHLAYPRVVGRGLPLEFHRIPDGGVLAPGVFGIPEPLDIWPRATPCVLLVPLLSFDSRGHRLGYGAGFYDRTIALLQVPAIGIAYAGQEVPALPNQNHDAVLDAVLTERGLTRFRG